MWLTWLPRPQFVLDEMPLPEAIHLLVSSEKQTPRTHLSSSPRTRSHTHRFSSATPSHLSSPTPYPPSTERSTSPLSFPHSATRSSSRARHSLRVPPLPLSKLQPPSANSLARSARPALPFSSHPWMVPNVPDDRPRTALKPHLGPAFPQVPSGFQTADHLFRFSTLAMRPNSAPVASFSCHNARS